jgi:flagellar hook-basal body complex protein FliE
MNVAPLLQGSAPIIDPQPVAASPATPAPAGDTSFSSLLNHAVSEVTQLQQTAHASAESFMRGETNELHKVALDQQRAAISFDLFVQMRNKVVSAYQEIMRAQL